MSGPPRRLSRSHARLAIAVLGMAAAPAAPAVAQGPDDEISDAELNELLNQIGQESAPGDAEDVGQPPDADNVNGPPAVEESPELNNQPEAVTVPPAPPEESVPEPPPPAQPQAPPPAQPAPAPSSVPATPPVAPAPPPAPASPPPAPAPPAVVPAPPAVAPAPAAEPPPARVRHRRSDRPRRRASQTAGPEPVNPGPPAAPAPQPSTVEPAPAAAPPSAAAPAQAVYTEAASEMLGASRGNVYVVKAGDTLWEIAQALLGPGASSAEIAREVSRLWRQNGDRIASGSPDLIRPGERLLLG